MDGVVAIGAEVVAGRVTGDGSGGLTAHETATWVSAGTQALVAVCDWWIQAGVAVCDERLEIEISSREVAALFLGGARIQDTKDLLGGVSEGW